MSLDAIRLSRETECDLPAMDGDMKRAYVYILTNDRLNVLYTGSSNDLRKRLVHHKRRLVPGFTRKYNVHRLVYFEAMPDMDAARRRERQIKGMCRAKKQTLIDAFNPQRLDLFESLPCGEAEDQRRDPSVADAPSG